MVVQRGDNVRVVVTPHAAVSSEQLAQLSNAHPRAEIAFVATNDEFKATLPSCDATITSFPISSSQLVSATRLRWVQAMGVGMERFLTPALARSSLTVTATKGPMSVPMAEHVVAMMLALARRLPEFFGHQQERRWQRPSEQHEALTEVNGKTMLVIGLGGVGTEVARMCKLGFQMRVLGMARRQKDVPFVDEFVDGRDLHLALEKADFVSLLLPLTPATDKLIDGAAFAAMKQSACLLNVARGGTIDESALIAALETGQIAGAGLDVVATEPLPENSPLWHLPNVIITPHTSAITDRLGDHFVDFWRENICRFVEGNPLRGLVDKKAGY